MSVTLYAKWDYQKQGSGTALTPAAAYTLGYAAYKAAPWQKGIGDARNYTDLLWDVNKGDDRIIYDQAGSTRHIIRQPASAYHIKYQKSVLLSATYLLRSQADMYETTAQEGMTFSTLTMTNVYWNSALEVNTQPSAACIQLINFKMTATDQPVNDPSGAWELNGAFGLPFPTLPQYTAISRSYNIAGRVFTKYFWVIRTMTPELAVDQKRPANFHSVQQTYYSGSNIITLT